MSRVRMILHHFDPLHPSLGGIDTCIRDVVRFAENHEFLLVGMASCQERQRERRWETLTLEQRRIEALYVASHPNTRALLPNVLRYATGMWRHRSAIRQRLPDVVQVHRAELVGVAQRILPRVPIDLFLHEDAHRWTTSTTESRWRWIAPAYRRLVDRAVASSDRVVCFSPSAARRLAARYPNIVASPTWFDADRFKIAPRRTADVQKVLWVGRLETVKDPLLAIRVMEHLPDGYELTIVGDGHLRERVEGAIRSSHHAKAVRLVGPVNKKAVAALMRSHDVLMMTSHSEGFPRVMVEALATGRPVVATPEADAGRLLVHGVNGGRAASRDPRELARLILGASGLSPESCFESVADLAAPYVVSKIVGTSLG